MSDTKFAGPYGEFIFTDSETGTTRFKIKAVEFTLFKIVSADMSDLIQLAITISSEQKGDVSPALTTDWLEIRTSDLRSKGWDALDGLIVHFDESSDVMDPPAALYEAYYGPVQEFDLHLTLDPKGHYSISVSGIDEFGRTFRINSCLPIFSVGVRDEDGSASPLAEAWLEAHFDVEKMTFGWVHWGPKTGGWLDLEAEFNQ